MTSRRSSQSFCRPLSKMFGTSMLTARLVAAAFGLLLILALHELVRDESGPWAALLAAFFLIGSPGP